MRYLFALLLGVASMAAHSQGFISGCGGIVGWYGDISYVNTNLPAGNFNPCTLLGTANQGMYYSDGANWVPFKSSPVVGTPTARTLSLATAYQATDTSKPAVVTVNLTSTATLSLTGGTTNTAQIVIGSTNGVASGTGTVINQYSNTNTGALTVGLNLSTVSAVPATFTLPAGWYFAVRQTSGTVSITSAFDQSLG